MICRKTEAWHLENHNKKLFYKVVFHISCLSRKSSAASHQTAQSKFANLSTTGAQLTGTTPTDERHLWPWLDGKTCTGAEALEQKSIVPGDISIRAKLPALSLTGKSLELISR